MREYVPHITASLLLLVGVGMVLRVWFQMRRLAPAASGAVLHRRVVVNRLRLRQNIGYAIILHALLIGIPLIAFYGCRHETPRGVLGGKGETIALGKVPTNLQKVLKAEQQKQQQQQTQRRRITRESLLQVLRQKAEAREASDQTRTATFTDDVGLPDGVGTGSTAAGSPHGTSRGKLYLYRIKYDGGSWDANPKALPALLKEVQKATNIEVAGRQEVVTLKELPSHSGKFWPRMLFITGTGGIKASDAERKALRDYLVNGGLLLADSSGGSFEQGIVQLIRATLPEYALRPIELDHDVYRSPLMPYQMPSGCPIYRDHGSRQARGAFDKDGRLMVFISPGDLGSAWATIELGKSRRAVELAFQMGTNLVSYGLLNSYDRREEKK